MAEAEKGSDAKPGEPSDAPQAGSEPKKSSLKAPKEDGSTSGKKSKKKKKKKKAADDAATHDSVGKIASDAASNKDTSAGSAKKLKGVKKSSSKEGKSDGKASKKGLRPTLSGIEAKDAIKDKKSKKKKKKKKHVASHLPSSPVALHPPPDATSQQPYLAYPPGTLPFAAQPLIPQPPPASAPETSLGVISKLEAFLGLGERTDASQHPPADFTATPNVVSQLHPPPFLAPQGPQMPYGPSQSMPGQPAPAGGQPAMTAQQTPLVTVQPNVGQQEGYGYPTSGQPTLDHNVTDQQATVDQAMRGQNMLVQTTPVEPIQGYIAPSQSLPSQLMRGQPTPIEPTPAELVQDAIDDMPPPSHEDYDVTEPAESRRDSSARRRSSCRRLSQSTSRVVTRELDEDFDPNRVWRFSVGREESSELPRRAASASRPYQLWETRCTADTTQHIKYTAAVAEDLRVASLALRRLRYDNETERRRRDFLATELMKRAALASSEVRRASMALAAMYPEDVFPRETASSTEQRGRRLPKVSAKKAEMPARPAAGPGGEHKAQGVTSVPSNLWSDNRKMSHRGQGTLLSRPADERGSSSQFQEFLSEATSSGAAAMPSARKAMSKRSLARKSSRASLATDAESSSHDDSGCDMCGGLWRGLVREAPSEQSSTTQCEDAVLELGGHVTGPLTWPLSYPGGRKRSSVATVTALSAVRRGSRKSEQPKQDVPDVQVTAVLLEEVQTSPLECFQGLSHNIVASIAGKGDAHHRELEEGGQAQPVIENAEQEDGGPYHPMHVDGGQPALEEANVEAEMWKFAESTVPMFPESGVAVLFLLACLVWMVVLLFAGSVHHNSVTDHEAKTGRSRPEDERR
ncbi:hypothetical protein HPB52_003786 [Rhipicephalus sanguineus]|uniref:Transmembrane protein n=1 Tax=Rhipicephalus sanguineus TaxID=34632 RepID=A0A9D4PLL8_RHISA|nr:hypothetical protein HPB52_003786 [Rhipicephalus sanguineus]